MVFLIFSLLLNFFNCLFPLSISFCFNCLSINTFFKESLISSISSRSNYTAASPLISGKADLLEITTGISCDIASNEVKPNTSQYEVNTYNSEFL